jgi:MoaA/NifB/PqqE/SkfB family radical SAM enzyme
MKARELFYYLRYGISSMVLRRYRPIVAGIPLTDVCNLHCAHCVVANKGRGPYGFNRIMDIFRTVYGRGARILYLQGGEIMTWADGGRNANDVIRAARDMGFFRIAAVTNGTFPIDLEADMVWVSMDGAEEYHDAIRGPGAFSAAIGNIRKSMHPALYANLTVNRMNRPGVERLIRFVQEEKNLRGISVNFHTPYPGVEDLALAPEERRETLETVIRMKKQGYKIINSLYGLKALMTGRYGRPIHSIQLMEHDRIYECCWGRETPGVCERCGYGIIPELSGMEALNPRAFFGALKLMKAG